MKYKIYNTVTKKSSTAFDERTALKKFVQRGGAKVGLKLIPVREQQKYPFTFGETYKMPSGLGGVFLLVCERFSHGKYFFRIITPGFERTVHYTIEEAKSKLQKAY